MSYVTSVTVVVTYASPEFREAVTRPHRFRSGEEWADAFRELDMDAAGGTKGSYHAVFAAAINYADRETLRAWADALPWLDFVYGIVLVDSEGHAPEVWTYAPKEVTSWMGR